MSESRPVIAVTGPEYGGAIPWLMTRLAIYRAGGKAIRIHTGCRGSIPAFDGLVIGGGSDIHPDHYSAELVDIIKEPSPRAFHQRLLDLLIFVLRLLFSVKLHQPPQDYKRDELERSLVTEALANNLPILGICRGEQMINVALGGTLHQDTREFYTETPDTRSIRPVKVIEINTGSRLADIIETRQLRVNSLHSQAVDRLGDGLKVCARDRNGIIQAIELPDRLFVVGVQWHPEYLPGQQIHQRLFRKLIVAARAN